MKSKLVALVLTGGVLFGGLAAPAAGQVRPQGMIEQMPPEEMGNEIPPEESAGEIPVEEQYVEEEPPQEPPPPPVPVRPVPRPTPPPSRPMPGLAPPPASAGQTVQPANEYRPVGGQTVGEATAFNFENADLLTVIKAVAAMTGQNFDIDPQVASGQQVTLITHDKIPPDLAYQVLESILMSRGYAMQPTLDGHLIKIVPVGSLAEKRELAIGAQIPLPRGYDTFLTHVVPVQYGDASEISNLIKNVGSQHARVDVYVKTNSIILSDTADGVRKMLQLLEALDVPGYDTRLEIFTLEYTRAEVLAQQVDQVLVSGQSASEGPMPPRPATPTRAVRPAVLAQAQSTVAGSREEVLRMVPDERLNALIVVATDGLMEQVRQLIARLDTPTPSDANNMHVYPLLNANAEEVEAALNALTSGTTAQRGQAAAGGPQGEQLQPFERNVLITRFEQTNSLLIVASPQDYKLLKEIIAQLDLPQRQVHVEAMILEVAITDAYDLRVETTALDDSGFFGLSNVVQLANIITRGPLAGAGLGGTLGYIDGTTEVIVPAAVDADGNPTGGFTRVRIPNVPLLIKAIESLTDLDVLSKPSLTTIDNEEAKIIVGQEVPVVRSLADTDDRTGFQSRSQVDRQDVGVKLTVTPQINEGDYVAMNVAVEVSQPVASTVGIDPNQVGATFQKSQVTNRVVIKDGTTGVIGGLISASRDSTRNQTPILGDVPLVGFLFRNKATSRLKRNLVVLLTPHIVKEGMDLDRQTRHRIQEFSDANIDALFEKGFINRIKSKSDLRNKRSPSGEAIESLNEGSFGRGSIAR